MFGWKARVAAVLPAVNTTLEGEARTALPDGISFHTSRFQSVAADGSKTYATPGLSPVMRTALQDALSVDPDVVVLGCTTATFLHGAAYDSEITRDIADEVGRPFFTAAGSALLALKMLGSVRPALISPYDAVTDERVARFLQGAGLEVTVRGGPPGLTSLEKGRLPVWAPVKEAQDVDLSKSDAIFLSCTNWRTLEAIPALEDLHQLPVVSSNQALFWRVLGALGETDAGKQFGSLFSVDPTGDGNRSII